MDISYAHLFIGYLLLIIPIYCLYFYKTGLVKDTIVSAARMSVQLFLIGIYLEYLFRLNNPFVNLAWVILMIFVTSFTIVQRTKLPMKLVLLPIILAIFISTIIVAGFFLTLVLNLSSILEARYLIPISGMMLGNMLTACVIALNTFYSGIKREKPLYEFSLANGATPSEAQHFFMRDALIKALNPNIATMSVMGLVSLPGTMTGQILGGSSPSIAIKYQILIMIAIFASSITSVIISILLSTRRAFSRTGVLKL
ncbi:MAG: ABC transporter permease [Bacteroidales bacterium]